MSNLFFISSMISIFLFEESVVTCNISELVAFDYLDKSDNWSSLSNSQCLICSTSDCNRHRRMCSGHSVDSAVTVVFRQCMQFRRCTSGSAFILDCNSVPRTILYLAECCKILCRLMVIRLYHRVGCLRCFTCYYFKLLDLFYVCVCNNYHYIICYVYL